MDRCRHPCHEHERLPPRVYGYTGLFNFQLLWQIAWLLPLVPLGVWMGRWGVTKVDEETFEWIITGLLVIAALLLILA